MLMVQGQWFSPGTDLSTVLPLREAVFQQGADARDAISWNVRVDQNGQPVAAGRIWWEEGAYRLGSIGVLPSFRNLGLGDLVLRLLLFKAQNHSAREVRLSASPEVSAFFARLGFRPDPTADDPGEMVLPGNEIDLDTCRSCPRQDCPKRSEG